MKQIAPSAVLILALTLLALLSFASASESSQHAPYRIVAVGDLHGDYDQALAILRMAEVVDDDGHWIGDRTNTTLVQVGDMVDRGDQDREVVELFMRLRDEGRGRVHVLLGNHEHMNLAGQLHYVSHQSMHKFGGSKREHRAAWSRDAPVGKFARSLPVVHLEAGTLFVHAGLHPSWVPEGGDLSQLNEAARKALEIGDFENPVFGVDGPVWTRVLYSKASQGQCNEVRETLAKVGAKRMVVGHTPARGGHLRAFCDDAFIGIDVGISKWMFGELAALEITPLPNGEVELREILANHAHSAQNEEVASAANMDEAIKKDPSAMQEILDIVREMTADEKRKPRKNEDL